MKEFRIIESRPLTHYWEYIVEAETPEAALEKIINGHVEPSESWEEEDETINESQFEVYLTDDI